MIQLTPQMRVLVYTERIDFRKGIDSLTCVCRQKLKEDPFSGTLFVFCNRSRKAIKILVYDGQGFWLCLKRLSKGRFGWWSGGHGNEAIRQLRIPELQILLWNGDPQTSRISEDWRKVQPA